MPIFDYLEMPVQSATKQGRFYADAFGWKFTEYGPDYSAYEKGPCQFALNAVDAGHRTRTILPLIRVSDLEAVRADVLAAGAKITRDIFDFPGGRRFHFTDPEGLELGCYEPS